MILKELLNNNFQQIRTKELCQLRQIELISRHRHPVFRCAFIHLKKERKDDSILWRQPIAMLLSGDATTGVSLGFVILEILDILDFE